ncbi:hypothetical protein [Paenibacillus sp. 1001270B_150601_E10]|uniref:hypothetical protein n=1 Tax=Paenibacillus sp. 1001270B_150601_E10 TaxID=2787079 RepID=UPI0018A0C6E4|nr:hypothetical protein [Paenibacillus sp. 1001270B_150601_E10]
MKRGMFGMSIVMVILILSGCGAVDKIIGSSPPQPSIQANGKTIAVYQSSYCWGNTCADYADPEMLLKDKEADQVTAQAAITFKFKGKQPTETSLSTFRDGIPSEVKITDQAFEAPKEEGTYYYGLSATWLKDKEQRISEGSSSYVFALKVKGTK